MLYKFWDVIYIFVVARVCVTSKSNRLANAIFFIIGYAYLMILNKSLQVDITRWRFTIRRWQGGRSKDKLCLANQITIWQGQSDHYDKVNHTQGIGEYGMIKKGRKKNVSITPTPNNNPVLCFYFSFLYSIACLFRSYVGMATPTWTSGRGGFNFSRPGRADCAMELCFLRADNLIYGFIVTNLSNRHIVYLALSISHFNSLVWDQGFRWQLLVVQVLILV